MTSICGPLLTSREGVRYGGTAVAFEVNILVRYARSPKKGW